MQYFWVYLLHSPTFAGDRMTKAMLQISKRVWACDKCNGCRFRTPPLPGIFPKRAKILIIAQNPGEGGDDMRFANDLSYQAFMRWYREDFISSRAHKEIAKLFPCEGNQWHKHYAYTNLVKCRTPNNALPSFEMVQQCPSRFLIPQIREGHYYGLLMIGNVAGNWIDANFHLLPSLRIPHYSFLARNGQNYLSYADAVERFLQSKGIGHVNIKIHTSR